MAENCLKAHWGWLLENFTIDTADPVASCVVRMSANQQQSSQGHKSAGDNGKSGNTGAIVLVQAK